MKEQFSPAIIVVTYNRIHALSRLLKSLANAKYNGHNITLVISIDQSPLNKEILKVANEFIWEHGEKVVINHGQNLGLRKHVLFCGDLTLKYGSAIILEDDLFVSENFYAYAKQALEFTSNDKRIAGVSLYNHKLNVHNLDNFTALADGFDNWYFQFAASWGQAWTVEQWRGFKEWYQSNGTLHHDPKFPRMVVNWPESSWLKFFVVYMIEKNKYFLYPRVGFSTNFSETGTHNDKSTTAFQVPLAHLSNTVFRFSSLDNSWAIYDAFFENQFVKSNLELHYKPLSLDLFGVKEIPQKGYLLSSKILNHKIIKSFGLNLKPVENNIIHEIVGNNLFLYDLSKVESNVNEFDRNSHFVYNHRIIKYKDSIHFLKSQVIQKVKKLISL